MLEFDGSDEGVEVADALYGVENQIGAEDDEAGVQHEDDDEKGHDLKEVVKLGGGDEKGQDGQGQRKDGDAGAQAGEGGAFLGEEELDFIEDVVVNFGGFEGFHEWAGLGGAGAPGMIFCQGPSSFATGGNCAVMGGNVAGKGLGSKLCKGLGSSVFARFWHGWCCYWRINAPL